jgi:photosystem II stability/assembly factor-like uncharacterized protein
MRALVAIVSLFLTAATFGASQFKAMQWREIGPYRGGRSSAVEGIAAQRNVYYFGTSGGGVWKTTDGGQTWKPVSDGYFGGSIGAVAVSEWDPNVVYAGTGEQTVRGNVSPGTGMWKSTDAGKTWSFVGLANSQHIPRIRIHPRNPDLVYAAVLGHLFGPSQDRGVYRSRDGGKTWDRILFVNENAGAVDLTFEPGNPRVLYASTWRVRRSPHGFESGGEGSALWKSTDGGDHWTNITANKGLPKGTIGIIGVTVSPSNSQNVYAIVEAEEGGVFRSRDGGETWTKTNETRDLRQRAWYYTRIYADPKDEDAVYVVNVRFHKSKDGGKTFGTIATPHGDNHDLWIDPNDPLRMIEANDGGANVSTDGGASWTEQDQPTAQFYRVTTDNAFPYRLLGAQQDNSAIRIRSRSTDRGIGIRDWDETAGGESGHIVAKPDDAEIVYGGSYGGFLTMINHRTGESRDVNPWPDNPMGHGASGATERFQWNFPLLFSPHDANTLYAASQHLFRSTDGGSSWTKISDDLTRNDVSKMGASGGPITKDNTSVEYYGTIFAVAESPLERGVIWTGSDDGLLHISRDGGQTWKNVTPAAMPQWLMINSIDPSPFDKGTAYVAGTLYKADDFRPYLYKTADYGATWTKITNGIASDHFTRVVRTDRRRKGLLYAGTERGMYVSFDDGASWQTLQLNLPMTPITDLAWRDDDLIAATEGRGFWILDDISPLQQWNGSPAKLQLFQPRATWRMGGATPEKTPEAMGKNPPQGVVVNYWIPSDVKTGTPVKLAFLNRDGSVIRELTGEVKPPPPPAAANDTKEPKDQKAAATTDAPKTIGVKSEGGEKEQAAPPDKKDEDDVAKKEKEKNKLPDSAPGFNRYAWDMQYPEAKKFEGLILWGGGTDGPRVVPGTYSVRLNVGDQSMTVPAEIKQDPRTSATPADLQAQFEFLLAANRKLTEVHTAIERIREVRKQLDDLRKRVGSDAKGKPLVDAAKALDTKMTAIEEALYQTKNRSPQDPLNFPIRLNDKLANVADSASYGDFAPTAQQRAVATQLISQIDAQLAQLNALWASDLPALNALVKQSEVPAIK